MSHAPYKEYMPATNKEGWSKRVESLQKDVECTFGSLKKRFLAIKNPIRFADAKDVQAMFMTCCAIHNLLLARNKDNNITDEFHDDVSDNNDNNNNGDVGGNPFHYDNNMVYTLTKEEFQAQRNALVQHYLICAQNHSLELN